MDFITESFKVPDADDEFLRIRINGKLTIEETNELRDVITTALHSSYKNIYIDASAVTEADISGINEIINAHYLLEKASKKLTFVYRGNTSPEKLVSITGLDKYIDTAIVPA